eukprot:5646135-Alexandrium_andersonii.AAC.1
MGGATLERHAAPERDPAAKRPARASARARVDDATPAGRAVPQKRGAAIGPTRGRHPRGSA